MTLAVPMRRLAEGGLGGVLVEGLGESLAGRVGLAVVGNVRPGVILLVSPGKSDRLSRSRTYYRESCSRDVSEVARPFQGATRLTCRR